MEGKSVELIIEEVLNHRDAWGKVRGLLRVALSRDTKADFCKGCLAVLDIADGVHPAGRGFQGGSAAPGPVDTEKSTRKPGG